MPTYKKYYAIPATPEEVYLALTKELSLQLWTGMAAQFIDEPGTEFSLWDGDIAGKNLELEYGVRLVQEWYFGEENAPSLVTIKLHPDKKGTSLEYVQTNIPETDFKEFTAGLEEHYFKALKSFFEE